MQIKGSVALVTGANRGLGAAFARGLIAAGAAKVYAAAREPASVSTPGVIAVRLDVTRPDDVAALARELGDVSLLVNNAGIFEPGPLLAPASLDALQRQFSTNTVGPLRMVQAFAPALAANGGGAVINVMSVLSWLSVGGSTGTYSASKAAGWALGNALRQELQAQKTALLSIHSAYIDTDMARGAAGDKLNPDDLVRMALAALEAGQHELLADATTRTVHAGLTARPASYIGIAA